MKALLQVVALSLVSSVAMAAADVSTVRVEKVSLNGTGCPQGSGVSSRWEQGELVLSFVDFAATRGTGLPLSASRKNCVLTLSIAADEGISFTLGHVSATGYAVLNAGTQAVLNSQYYFQGQAASTGSSLTIQGPYADSFSSGDLVQYAQALWSSCSVKRALNLNTSVRVTPVAGAQTIGGEVLLEELRLGIETKACP